jgi:glutamyl-tRNA synthetase
MADVVTRFAPSPTGYLHIGGARTALFNWLFARHHCGRYLLRVEDTDRKRSTPEAVDAIFDGLAWLGLDHDDDPYFQHEHGERHRAVFEELLDKGLAYRCYCTPEELVAMREKRMADGEKTRYDRRWRDKGPDDWPTDEPYAIRFKAPTEGETIINDGVQGDVRFANNEFDDIIIARSDGTPTYNLAVVVDDHDMGVSHVIRGVDHLTNAFQQNFIYRALEWNVPIFAHVPLIHGPDGAKLSKRHGALGVGEYRDMGYLPDAMRNYLLRLGWSHGDDEVISTRQAIEWFGLETIGRSPARFDFDKLGSVNGHYIREGDDEELSALVAACHQTTTGAGPSETTLSRLVQGMGGLKSRAKTVIELTENAALYLNDRPLTRSPKADKLLTGEAPALLGRFAATLDTVTPWDQESLEAAARAFAEAGGLKLGAIAQPLRAALTGSHASPGIFEVMAILGRDETLGRISDVADRT